MFNVRPDLRVPGFNVREPEQEVPGFRLNADGTIGKAPMTAAKPAADPFDIFEPQPLAAWAPPYLATDRDPLAGAYTGVRTERTWRHPTVATAQALSGSRRGSAPGARRFLHFEAGGL